MHALGVLPGEQDLRRRAGAHGQLGTDRDGVAQTRGALRGCDAHAELSLASPQLCRLPGDVAEPGEDGTGCSEQTVLPGGSGELGETRSEDETALYVTGHQTMVLQGYRDPVSGGPGQAGAGHQTGKGRRSGLQGGEHQGGFVEDTDSARVVHTLIMASQMLESKSQWAS